MTNPSESGAGNASRKGHIECTLHADPRLISAVGTIVGNAAERAGLPDSARAGLAAAVVETCRKMFPHSPSDGSAPGAIRVDVTDFSDRVEVLVEASGKLDIRPGDGTRKSLQDLKVERAQCDVGEGRIRLTLTKQCGDAKSSQTA